MPNELIAFKFEGGPADDHAMDYYTAARFDYSAARLLLKITHYQQAGIIPKNVSKRITTNITNSFIRR